MTVLEADFDLWSAEHGETAEGCELRDDTVHDGPLVNVTVSCASGGSQTLPACASCREWVTRMSPEHELLLKGACCGGITHPVLTVTEASGLVLYTWRRGPFRG